MASVDVWWCSLDDFAWAGPLLDAILSEDERRRRDAFVFDIDRQMYALSHAMLRLLLGPYSGNIPCEIKIRADGNGRPYLAGASVDFNLSHTKGWAAVAISHDARVGVDIESTNRNVDSLVENSMVLTDRERHDCLSQPLDSRGKRFLSYWVLKESLLKGLGEGLSRRPDEIEFVLSDPPRIVSGLRPGQRWSSQLWQQNGSFLVGLAVSAPSIEIRFHRFSFDSRIDEM